MPLYKASLVKTNVAAPQKIAPTQFTKEIESV